MLKILEKGYITVEEWNSEIIDALHKGLVKDMSFLLPRSFLYIHQVMHCLIEDSIGNMFECYGDKFGRVELREWSIRWR